MRFAASAFIAARSFFGRKSVAKGGRGRNYLHGAVAGVALAVVPLTVVLFVADGMIQGITSRYLETSTYHLQASPWHSKDRGELEAAARGLARVEGVRGAYPEFQGPAIVLGPVGEGPDEVEAEVFGALVRAVDPSFLEDAGVAAYLKAVEGTLGFSRENEVILGASLAHKMQARPGDLVSFLTARQGEEAGGFGAGVNPKLSTLRVRAIASTGYEELDALWAFVPLSTGSRMLAPGTRRALVGIKVDSPWIDLDGIRQSLEESVNGEAAEPEWSVQTWPQLERNLWKSFATTRSLLMLVMALAVAVAAVNVGSALIMLSLERRKDIAILMSAGASSRQVGAIFVLLGAFTGLVGSILGLAAGSLIAVYINEVIAAIESVLNLAVGLFAGGGGGAATRHVSLLNPSYYLERIPVAISPTSLLLIAAMGVGLSVAAALLPARKAASQAPLEIFRKS